MRSCNADGEYGRGDPNEGTAKKKVAEEEEEEEVEEEEALSTERGRRRRGYEFRKGGPPRARGDRPIDSNAGDILRRTRTESRGTRGET